MIIKSNDKKPPKGGFRGKDGKAFSYLAFATVKISLNQYIAIFRYVPEVANQINASQMYQSK